MGFLDVLIIVLILFGAYVGYCRGIISEFFSFCGFIIIMVLSFMFKNYVSAYLYTNFPFFQFSGILKGVSVINILLYEVISFFVLFMLLYVIFKIILMISHVFEKFLNDSILLNIPLKIGGALLGMVENYFVVFIILYILSLPFFNISIVRASKFRPIILEKTPIINKYVDGTVKAGKEFWDIAENYMDDSRKDEFNLETLDLLLKYHIVDVDSIDILTEKKKLQINNIESVLMKYRNN